MLTDKLLHFIQTEKNISMEFVQKARKLGKGVYLYGAGYQLRFAVRFMQKYQVPINAILDTNRSGEYQGIPIFRFTDFMAREPEEDSWFVISAPSVVEEITKCLADYFPRENVFSFAMQIYVDYIPDVEEYRSYLLEHWRELSELFDNLADNKSRVTLEAVLRGRISGDPQYFGQCFVPDQYYPKDIIHWSSNEVMVELGGNNGETLLEFLKKCPDYRSVYCFEPDPISVKKLNSIARNLERNGTIHIVPKGAWDCSTVLQFCSDGEGVGDAHILQDEEGTADFTIETASVDEVVKEPVSFLKMDIEGAELRALHGAKKQILENRPKLAVCVYHKIEDFLDIWNYLRKLVPEYRFYLRHHVATEGTDTILYAVT